MQYRQIGLSSLSASVIGIGALHFGVYCDKSATTKIIHKAIDSGINFIDTAPMYGHGDSESYIRDAIRGIRDKVIVSTKVGLEPKTAPDGTFAVSVARLDKKNIRAALHKSLLNLGTDYIDLYQIHAYDPSTPLEETLSALDELIKEGKIRFIGCSNFNREQYEEANLLVKNKQLPSFSSFQVHFNLIERKAEEELLPVCREENSGVICNRALARGILSGKYVWNQPLPEGSRAVDSYRVRRWLKEETLTLVELLGEFAKERKKTVTELSLAWLMAKSEVSVVLVGMRNLEHVETARRAVEWNLIESDRREVDALINRLNLMSQVQSRPETFFEK